MVGTTLTCPVKLGDYAETTTTGYQGRVSDLHLGCPEDASWLELQDYLTLAQRGEYVWVSILTTTGGAVVAPASTVRRIDPIPGFTHPWADFYFHSDEVE